MIVGPLQFDRPLWLLLAPLMWLLIWLIARRSLSGLGTATRRTAWTVRIMVAGLIAVALAEPSLRREGKDVSVVVVLDQSASMPPDIKRAAGSFLRDASADAKPTDRLGGVSAGEDALARVLPSTSVSPGVAIEESILAGDLTPGGVEGTDLADGVRMAMAIKPEDSAARIVLISDGNETEGNLLATADRAKAAGIPIDVVPVRRNIDREVIFEELVSPATGRKGQTVDVFARLRATRPTSGLLTLLVDDEPFDLSPGEPGAAARIDLEAGDNPITIPVPLLRGGAQRFRAVFEPLDPSGDAITANNEALAVTFVSSEGKVLFYADDPAAAEPLAEALRRVRVDVEIRPGVAGHQSKEELQEFDAIVLMDVPASDFSRRQQEELASYVHDAGGGLVMVGGPNSFGAGGWLGTPVADAIPVLMDVPEKRQMPRGALVLIMHSCEMPQGNYWGQRTAQAATDALSRLDLVGIYELDWRRGERFIYPLSEKGEGAGVNAAINNLSFGDMQSFVPGLTATLAALQGVKAGQKHVIIISDGDPTGPSPGLLRKYVAAGISITTFAVFPHGFGRGGSDVQQMAAIAEATDGNHYFINSTGTLAKLPQLFMKEAQIVKRSLIWEGEAFQPRLTGAPSQAMRGIPRELPAMTGYVVTTEREGLAVTTAKAPEPNPDPIVAQWQHGLGRAVAFTSDATSRWDGAWIGWPGFETFWEQHIRWAMRPTGSNNVTVTTRTEGGKSRVVVTALDERGEALNFGRFRARVVNPDLEAETLELTQTGPGRYEGSFDSSEAGSHLVTMMYDVAGEGGAIEDSGTVQAAVARPFADEHRVLEDNAGLLRQVAELTGGRVWTEAPPGGAGGLYSRAGLEMPVALRPIWLAVALAAMGLFLMDVAVRRVRIDFRAFGRAARAAAARTKAQSEAQVGALRTAREAAGKRVAAAKEAEREQVRAGLSAREAKAEKKRDRKRASVKFEASDEEMRRGAKGVKITDEAQDDTPSKKKADAEDEEAGMSRLMRAKKRAQQGMRDTEKGGDGR